MVNWRRASTIPVNGLVQYSFQECSNLPNLSSIGLFSCNACVLWRDRKLGVKTCSKERSSLGKRYRCTRSAPVRIRIMCNAGNQPEQSAAEKVAKGWCRKQEAEEKVVAEQRRSQVVKKEKKLLRESPDEIWREKGRQRERKRETAHWESLGEVEEGARKIRSRKDSCRKAH